MGGSSSSISISRRRLLAALSAAAAGGMAGAALANAPLTSLRPLARSAEFRKRTLPSVDALIAEAELGGKTSFAVADARSGAMLESRAPLLALPPASVTKAITALYALETLGPGHRFRTRLIATGPLRNGKLEGDLILKGGGDPTLDTDALGDMARDLKAAGLREITGRFVVDAGALPQVRAIDPGQPDHLGYNPAVSGLNLNYNRVHFEWRRANDGYAVTLDARARRYRPEVAVAEMRVVARDLPVYTYSDAGGADRWTVAEGALGGGGSRWLPVRKPERYAAEVFQTLARAHGLILPPAEIGRGPSGGTVLVEHVSPSLREILTGMLKYSTNLTAEAVGLAASLARGGRPRDLDGSAQAMTDWLRARLDARQARFVDHSGLGDGSRLSASDMVRALVAIGPEGPLARILKPIPMRDAAGAPLPDHPIQVRAKTGTLNFVGALAGYMRAEDGRDLAFAIFSADTARRAAIPRADRDRPPGARAWTRRSRRMQLDLLERWGVYHSG